MKILSVFTVVFLMFLTSCGMSSEAPEPGGETPRNISEYYLSIDSVSNPVVIARIEDGKVIVCLDKEAACEIMPEDMFAGYQEPFMVEGLEGEPCSVFIGDIGQDYNPMLCVLNTENQVFLLGLFSAFRTGDFKAGRIFPDKAIVAFEEGPGGEWEDEDGEVFYDYTTIYAVEKEGDRDEIFIYDLFELFSTLDDKGETLVRLASNWNMRLTKKIENKTSQYEGFFWIEEEDFDEMVFTYGYELHSLAGDENGKGSFVMSMDENDGWRMMPSTGLLLGDVMYCPVVECGD